LRRIVGGHNGPASYQPAPDARVGKDRAGILSTDASLSTTARAPAFGRPRLRLPRGRSDDALVARVRAGDERGFELVFDRYHRGLLAFCRRMLASDEEAEDAVQHTFMAAYRALRSSERPIHLKAWLYTIARNRCLSVLRARREQVALDDGHAATDGLAADVNRRAELRGLLADLDQLPEEQRAALVLFELGDHSHDEIAEVLGVRRDKVKALVFQARESLAGWRLARETPCREIREQLATARGAAFKRAALRRHVARCEGCARFETEVRRQRSAMALLLPVVPTAGLKVAVLGAAGISAGAGAGAGGGSLAGLIGAAKGATAKALLCAAVAGSAGSAGYVAVHEVQMHDARGDVPTAAASHDSHRAGAGATHGARAAQAAKRVVISQTAPAVAPTTAAATAPKASPAAGAERKRHGKGHNGRHGLGNRPHRAARSDGHGRRGGWQRQGRRDGGQRGDSAQRGASLKRDHSAQRDRATQRGDSTERDRSARRGDSTRRDRSAQRDGSARRRDSTQRDRSAQGAHPNGSGQATAPSVSGESRPGTEGKRRRGSATEG
jgi:RNA polymerase sigma factor (sigma-70 family)